MLKNFCSTVLILFFLVVVPLHGQRKSTTNQRRIWDKNLVSIGTGFTNFSGDLESLPSPLGFNTTLEYNYRFSSRFWLRGGISLYNINGRDADSDQLDLRQRNLSFKATNLDSHIGIVFNFIPVYAYAKRPPINPFLSLGFGVTSNWARTNFNGKNYNLRKLKTELKNYSQWAAILPVGIGVSFKANPRLSFILESSVRFSYTDYLDDVSTVYPNPDFLPSDIARSLYDRGWELGIPARPPGSTRGNSDRDDAYYFMTIKVEFSLF